MNSSLSGYPGADSPLETTGTYDLNPRLFDDDDDGGGGGQEMAEWSRDADGGYRPPPLGQRPHAQQGRVASTMAPLVALQESGLFDGIGALTNTTGSGSTLSRGRNGGAQPTTTGSPITPQTAVAATAPPLQRESTLPPDVAVAKGEDSGSEDFEGL